MRVSRLLRVEPGAAADLAGRDPRATPGFTGAKARARAQVALLAPRLATLQERLAAEGKRGGGRSLLLVLQAMDAGGKDGAVKHVVGLVNPAGVKVTSFGRPTPEELAHDFLWRVAPALPAPGQLAVFNRSQYEDVLVVRVHDLVARAEWESRYARINAFEGAAAAAGTTVVKVFLHVSWREQRDRLRARLDDPTKLWKVEAGDLTERERWAAYQAAYEDALTRCSTAAAPWHVVPADRKWYRDWALTRLLVERLERMDPQWPTRPDLDLPALRAQLNAQEEP